MQEVPSTDFSIAPEGYMKIKKTTTPKILSSQYEFMGAFCIDIPEELLIDILTRLSLKTLARFKCVSKLWRRLILNDVPVTNAPKLFILTRSEKGEISFHSVDNEAHVKSMCSPVEVQNDVVKAHSSCHGLLLIQINEFLFIWNPLTKFYKMVLTIGEFNYRVNKDCFEMYLCYCAVNKEYSVALQVHCCSNSSNIQDFYIATCGARSWKKIENVNYKYLIPGPFFKGYRHWSCSSRKQVVYFDPSTNKFIEIAMPQRKEAIEDKILYLGVFDECLCITRWDDPKSYGKKLELVMMKEYGNGNSWEVMFVFTMNNAYSDHYGSMVPLFRTKKGEVLIGVYKRCSCCYEVEAYDVHGSFLRHIKGWMNASSGLTQINFNDILYEESWRSLPI